MNRKQRLSKFTSTMVCALLGTLGLSSSNFSAELQKPLDRQAIVARHRISSDKLDLKLQVGNGNFCFNVDGTGLQTFGGDTLSHWGWYSSPRLEKYSWDEIPATGTFYQGRLTGGDPWPDDKGDLYRWIRDNPHQINLARIRFVRADGKALERSEISEISRDLDLWTGVHTTTFSLDGTQTTVSTCVTDDVKLDSSVAVRVDSPLVRSGALIVEIDFPYPSLKYGAWDGDFSGKKQFQSPEGFTVTQAQTGENALVVKRLLSNEYAKGKTGDFSYSVRVDAFNGQVVRVDENAPTLRVIGSEQSSPLEITVGFDGGDYTGAPSDDSLVAAKPIQFDEARQISARRWEEFWTNGAAVDFSESSDPRWMELERRVVLSQYQLRANSAGQWPSSESGLICVCPWSGRFHMEMVWWHLSHWWTWDRANFADQAIQIYWKARQGARDLAEQLDYKGLKWQKEIAPDGRTAPWVGNLVLLWKQPHPIFFAELDYRRNPTRETLEKWDEIVEGTAEHMADYPVKTSDGRYSLTPSMPPSEQGVTSDEIFDLAYWRWGLDAANAWRERLGKERVAHWDEVRANLTPLPTKDGLYVHSPEWTDSFTRRNYEHPDLIGVFGMLPPIEGVDKETVERTLERVIPEWQWARCWGWDFPWTAMCATRCGRPDLAIEIILSDSICNVYDESGVNLGGPSMLGGKGPYLPGNGGLLYAIAGMCAGFDEIASDDNTNEHMPKSGDSGPGFPQGWKVKWEGLKRPL